MKTTMWVRLVLLAAAVCGWAAPCLAAGPWAGDWDTRWRGGGAHLELTQDGDKVAGVYKLYDGRIEATADGRSLTGRWIERDKSGAFRFDLSADGKSFSGRFDSGEWWTGGRAPPRPLVAEVDHSSPREVLRAFMLGGNLWHAGLIDQLGLAVAAMDFGAAGQSLYAGQKVEAAKNLFTTMDLTTLHLWAVPGPEARGPTHAETFTQSGGDASITLSFRKDDQGRWWIVAPAEADLAAARKGLLARFGGAEPAPQSYKRMLDARDTMKTFQGAFEHWDNGGAEEALAALDLSQIPSPIRGYEGLQAVQYLKRVIDHISQIAPQEIPNDPADRQPYVHFSHPAGNIVIAPHAEGDATVWRFTAETVRTAPALFAATEAGPIAASGALPAPPSAFFTLRAFASKYAPATLTRVGPVEGWQLLGGFLFFALCLIVAFIMDRVLRAAVRWDVGGARLAAERSLIWPLRVFLAAALFKLCVPMLGWPEQVRVVSAPIHALVLVVFGVWAGWLLIGALGHNVAERAERSPGRLDDILVSLLLGMFRLIMVFTAVTYFADQWSIPTSGLLAGLGISGLAVAFASRETLSNIFGAAILVIDHPFKRGDWIVADSVQGTVEHVGIRSTRIRTAEDTLLIVPNGKLADAAIKNWGTRRHRLSRAKFAVGYGANPAQLDAFIAGIRTIVAETPEAVSGRTVVGVNGLSERGVEVDLSTYLNVATLGQERRVNHELMLRIIGLAEELGLRLGTPTDSSPPPRPAIAPPRQHAPAPSAA